MSTATQTATAPLQVLLVGNKEEDFFLIREILERNHNILPAELDHARSLDEAHAVLQDRPYGLIIFEHETGDAEAVRLISEFHHAGRSVPFIILTENADEKTIAEIINSGNWNCVAKSQLDGATLVRSIRSTLALHSMAKEQRSAEESLRKLSRAVEQSADIVLITDRKGVIEYVNPAFETLTGYSRDEACGNTPRILKSGEQGPETYQEMWRTILAAKVFRGILVNRKKNGELYYVEESISPVRDADGQITHFIANGRDLTERLRLEAQLLQSQKMDAIGRLAGGVAHDFNNLLTIITSYSELALDAVAEDSPLASKIQEVLLAAKRAAELTRQLLAFSRKQPQALRIVDLNPVIAAIAKTLPRLIGEDVEFSFLPGQGIRPVRIDPVQMEQILMNLAANARDALPQGGHFRIETSQVRLDQDYIQHKPAAIPVGDYAVITVTDNGCGIPQEDISHIFEPFFTTKPSGKGTGLGLATVYGIVKQNKAFIWVYSEPGSGTVFKIYLPSVGKRCPIDPDNSKNERPAAGNETLLLVEDEQAVRKASAEFLRSLGYTVLEAKDGMDALALAQRKQFPIDLLVTDVVMPNMSGGELARQLVPLLPKIKFLFVSGYAGKTVLDHNVFDLETNFLQKPYSLKQLAGKIRGALEGRNGSACGQPAGLPRPAARA
ncbi:MAG TPA: PAS domain S-box protein [Candidatus Sulfotelmatobacter sp.]|nr:PAS domain S-box protein [Candidatus Sulfotelmatobacter sp.]